MQDYSNLFPESRIEDYKGGFDSVYSEDFDPGFGAVTVKMKRDIPVPPPMGSASKEDIEREQYYQKFWKNNS